MSEECCEVCALQTPAVLVTAASLLSAHKYFLYCATDAI